MRTAVRNDIHHVVVSALLIAGCSSTTEAPGRRASATAVAASSSPPPTAGAGPSAAIPGAGAHWAGCKVAGDAESLAVKCGSARFARRDIVVEIDETRVKASAGSFYYGTTGSEELAEVREGKLDDGTTAWISTSSGVLKVGPEADRKERALVFIGVQRPYGGGVHVSAVGPDAASALRDANAMWSSPPPVPGL